MLFNLFHLINVSIIQMKLKCTEAKSMEELRSFTVTESTQVVGHETKSNFSQIQSISTRQKLRRKNTSINYKETRTRTHYIQKKNKIQIKPKTKKQKNKKFKNIDKFNNKNKLNSTTEVQLIQQEPTPTDGYTFFTNQINHLYLSQPENHHFQILNKLLEAKEYSLHHIVSETTNLGEDIDGKTEEYLRKILCSKRKENQISLLLRNSDRGYQTFFSPQKLENQRQIQLNASRCMQLDQQLIQVMILRESFMKKLDQLNSQQSSNTDLSKVNEIFKQLLFLGKYLQTLQKRNFKQFYQLKNSMEEQQNSKKPSYDSSLDQYIEFLFFKNIKKALLAGPVQIKNYFKEKNQNQQGQFFRPFQTREQLINFIHVRKYSKNKPSKLHLNTSCIACLSDYSQQVNRLVHCKKCNTRTHIHCKSFYQDECNICKFSLLKAKDSCLKQCILCPKVGLANIEIDGNFIHVFCFIALKSFRIENQKIIISQKINDIIRQTQALTNSHKCYDCRGTSGYLAKFTDSQEMIHPLCGYFKGYQMDFFSDLEIYKNTFSNSELLRHGFSRAYRLNLNKIAYKYYSFEQYESVLDKTNQNPNENKEYSLDDLQ